ncbi:endonuclease/exonuclease/phosphatase family protein [Neisseria shayeganii]|uniref:Endonuclease/exonuclease/phosphatase family protein n=2 Tax=Neisseria shayeganii TaxID=607712 RepID=A0A7D7S8P0_9NEIS|nr:endonuclease/exonuclease/phosphatase family protein [Neisseria shayeganii]
MPPSMSTLRRYLSHRLHWLSVMALAAFLLSQTLGAVFWPAELFSHFLPHYTALFAAAAAFTQGRRRRIWLGTTLTAAVLMWQPFSSDAPLPAPAAPAWRMVWYNVRLDNPDPATETAALLAQSPDVLALAEIQADDPRWAELRRHHPHGCTHQEHSPFALAVWSRHPLAACDIRQHQEFAYIRAELPDGTAVYALHPPPPINSLLAAARSAYLAHTAAEISREPGKVVVVGDFNSSPFSPLFRRFTRHTGTPPYTPMMQPTWRPLFINIDHALANFPLHTAALPWQHSDHRALLLSWPRP